MFALRCTGKLLRRLGGAVEAAPPSPSTRLGNWYAHLLFTRPQVVLCVSERTLLPVLIPARESRLLVTRLRDAVGQVLRALGIPEGAIHAESQAMMDAVIAKTGSRQVLGSLNDFVRMLGAYRGAASLVEIAFWLAETPCGPLRMSCPHDETITLFSLPT